MKFAVRPLHWMGSSKRDFLRFPIQVRKLFGYELHLVQDGQHPPSAKPLKGFGGVLELIETHEGDAFRTVYTVRFAKAVYVLHAFKKKSKRGIATPKADIDLVKRRMADAARDYEDFLTQEKKT